MFKSKFDIHPDKEMGMVALTPDTFEEFKLNCEQAEASGQDTFNFQGEDVPVKIGRHVIDNLGKVLATVHTGGLETWNPSPGTLH